MILLSCLSFITSTILFGVDALALPPQNFLKSSSSPQSNADVLRNFSREFQSTIHDEPSSLFSTSPGSHVTNRSESISSTLEDLLYALNVMQDDYFELWQGTWPTSIDWTAAVLGTHVSASLSSLTTTPDEILASVLSSRGHDDDDDGDGGKSTEEALTSTISKHAAIVFENVMNHFFHQILSFYFGENSFGLRNQAYDDMLWVVLGWLENIKLQDLHTDLRFTYSPSGSRDGTTGTWIETETGTGARIMQGQHPWHGTQFRAPAAHRARLFYELASAGWDRSLCGGGMIWSPYLSPYKNAITNELYISASIGMYLYFPGDSIDSPFLGSSSSSSYSTVDAYPHNPTHLQTAIEAYDWLKKSEMTGLYGLYGDGFHIKGYTNPQNPGTSKCDILDTMIHSYNQGVVLSGLRGLYLSTLFPDYLTDGHKLIEKVIKATGWPDTSSREWKGLGRGGVMEDTCDSHGTCSQDGQVFKGIFFHHLTEFCRPLRPQEERFLGTSPVSPVKGNINIIIKTNDSDNYDYYGGSHDDNDDWQHTFTTHQSQCQSYEPWIEHNANAALVSRDRTGKFGMWWGRPYKSDRSSSSSNDSDIVNSSTVPPGAVDHVNPNVNVDVYDDQGQRDYNDRGRGRTVESQSGGVAVLRALYQWKTLG